MKNKTAIFGKIFLILILFYTVFSGLNFVHAKSLSDMERDVGNFMNAGKNGANIDYSGVYTEFTELGNILTMIGAGVMVGVTAYMGIKYLTAGPEAQAKLKTQLIGVVVSGMVIFGAYFIWKIVLQIVSQF